MTKRDITEKITEHEIEQLVNSIQLEVCDELKGGLPKDVLKSASEIRARAMNTLDDKNVIAVADANFKRKKSHAIDVIELGSVELLAASAKEAQRGWFEPILNVMISGKDSAYSIELIPYDNEDSTMKIVISANEGREHIMKSHFSEFADEEITLKISSEDKVLFTADVYVWPNANLAEGEGQLKQAPIKSKTLKNLHITARRKEG